MNQQINSCVSDKSKYPSGSEWRRWDLHVHTPGTNKNDQYSGKCIEEKWDNFYKSISEYVGDERDPQKVITVLGITDYVTLDNYKKVIQDQRLPDCIKLVIPNIEMRMTPVATKSPVNIHFLFDPDFVEQLDSRFFSQLTIDIGGTPYHPIKRDLIELGKMKCPDVTDESILLREGVEQFVVSKDAIDAVFKKDPALRKYVLIGVSNSTSDGTSGVGKDEVYKIDSGSQTDTLVSSIFQMCDFIFSGKPNDVQYFLGLKDGDRCSKQDVIRRCGSLMPCIIGSDAHCNEKLFEPDMKRYCWIKATPTFNGLRQIIYEPRTRVRIQEFQPERKEQYYVIDGVYLGNSNTDKGKRDDDLKGDFPENYIPFNEQLNCIIGGKSTGKSLLLHNIANAIDPTQVQNKCGERKNHIIDGVVVKWKDGTCSKSTDDKSTHKIVYIPQTYLNRLSESEDEATDIDHIIESIVHNKKENRDAYEKMKADLDSLKKTTDANIYQLNNLQNDLVDLLEKQKDIGTKEGIKKEIDNDRKRWKEISSTLSISENDIKKYSDAEQEVTELESKIHRLNAEKERISRIETVVRKLDFDSLELSPEYKNKFDSYCNDALQAANKSWEKSKAILLADIIGQISSYQEQIQKDKGVIDALGSQVKQNSELIELSERIKRQQEKLGVFNNFEQKITEINSKRLVILDDLADTFDNYKAIHEEYENFINDNWTATDDDKSELPENSIRFIVRSPFRRTVFEDSFRSKFNKTTLKSQKDIINLDNFEEVVFTPDKIKSVIKNVVEGKMKLLTSISKEDALRSILSDWYNTTYNVEVAGDTIGTMSPGKKALVLLKMLIQLEDSKCPILIDQPEDDLDNRSIYKELTPFILSKKVHRQIIVVTHNANVVLGADSEEVIVANQNGKNTPNDNYKFEYVTGAIEQCEKIGGGTGILPQFSIQEHICDILEGGQEAFRLREQKYRINLD